MKYRKKPVTIEAYQTDVELDIPTLEGTMHASVGDYIITGVRGEQYPCKPDIFIETYEPAEDGDDGTAGAATCHNVAGMEDVFECSVCGGRYRSWELRRWARYCPDCGARRVAEVTA